MKKLGLTIAACALVMAGGTAHAQSFTYDITWEPVESVGGLSGPDGPRYRGGAVSGTYTATYPDGTVNTGDLRCVGMGQPDGGVFAIHLACTATGTDEAGGTATSVYGCNYLGARGPETPLGCVGGIEAKDGPFDGRRGGLTMEWYSAENSRGTGQWYGNPPSN